MTGEFSFFEHPALQPDAEPERDRELVRVIIFGSRESVKATIHESHVKRFRAIETVNTIRLLDAGQRLWQEVKLLKTSGGLRSLSDTISTKQNTSRV